MTGRFNYFGDKAVPGDSFTTCPTHEDIHGCSVRILANFKNYPTQAGAFLDHAGHLATSAHYATARQAKSAEGFAEGLTGHYATDPEYGNKLITIMRESKLERYDV